MSRESELERLLGLLQRLPTEELRTLREHVSKRVQRITISRDKLEELVRLNRSTREIAEFFKVSPRTITRRISEYSLKGLRPQGRKPAPKAPRRRRARAEWISMRSYYNKLDKQYDFANKNIPPRKWINQETIVASNTKSNPKGSYTTVGIYYIVQQSDVYLVYALSIRYTSDPVPFDNIYHWVYPRAYDIVAEHAPREAFVVDVIALTFEKTDPKPEKIEVKP